ncbi:MAG: hypothetical protein LBB81_00095 [Treponema sp.]|jgi:flagellar basal-body rod protein FlgC|nr:hypothetical protein [Treponema sp.]
MRDSIRLKKYHIFILFFILFFLYKNVLADTNDNIFNNIYEEFLNDNDIPISFDEDKFIFIINDNIEEDDLIRFFELLMLSADIIADNIANYNTTRTYEGGPFIRKKIIIIDGHIKIIKDNHSIVKLVYNPSHPDSICTGDKKGYVIYPNVDIVSEIVDLIFVSRIYESIIEECQLKKIYIPEKYITRNNIDMLINDALNIFKMK